MRRKETTINRIIERVNAICLSFDSYIEEFNKAEIYCKELEGDKLLEVNHIDGSKINNHYKNLQWVTKSQNRLHSIYTLKKYSGFKKGGNHYNSKLNKEKVIEVKRLLKTGMTHSLIAVKFNVTRECITNIKNDKTWKHVII